jgi:hypothetical protein
MFQSQLGGQFVCSQFKGRNMANTVIVNTKLLLATDSCYFLHSDDRLSGKLHLPLPLQIRLLMEQRDDLRSLDDDL